jgi:hypothetical protein
VPRKAGGAHCQTWQQRQLSIKALLQRYCKEFWIG